jgi:ribonuclease-3
MSDALPEPSVWAELEAALGHRFGARTLLRQALTHPSYNHENPELSAGDNQRLEFLGDAVLGLVIARTLYGRYGDLPEGRLSRLKSALVCEDTLAALADELGVGPALLLGKGEHVTSGHRKASILADAVEALLGAIYLDADYETAAAVIDRLFAVRVGDAFDGTLIWDHKTALQEYAQAHGGARPKYRVTGSEGPAHDRSFTVVVSFEGVDIGEGRGSSKKEAEKDAAADAMRRLRSATPSGPA